MSADGEGAAVEAMDVVTESRMAEPAVASMETEGAPTSAEDGSSAMDPQGGSAASEGGQAGDATPDESTAVSPDPASSVASGGGGGAVAEDGNGAPANQIPQAELDAIMNGTHPEIIAMRKQLEIDYAKHIDGLHSLKRYREETARKQYAQDLRILQNQSKKAKVALRADMLVELNRDRQKLKEWFETARIEKDNDQRETRQTRNKKKTAAPNDSGDNGDGRGDSGEGSYVGPIFNAELKAGEIDSDLLLLKVPRSATRVRGKAAENQVDVIYQHQPFFDGKQPFQDRLRYDGKWYQRGYRITAEYADGTKSTGVIYMFTPDRVWVRRNDGEKFSLQLQALQNRKHTMRLAQGREL